LDVPARREPSAAEQLDEKENREMAKFREAARRARATPKAEEK
jgi:hypothetical protein